MRNVIVTLATLMLATALSAGEKKLMYCVYFSVVDSASEADWQAFAKTTDALPAKIPGLSKVWHGKLARPVPVSSPDGEARKELAAGEERVAGAITHSMRKYGVCMEFADVAAYKGYGPHPVHKEWQAVYWKVCMPDPTLFDFIGQEGIVHKPFRTAWL